MQEKAKPSQTYASPSLVCLPYRALKLFLLPCPLVTRPVSKIRPANKIRASRRNKERR